jgi:hypothetical protein
MSTPYGTDLVTATPTKAISAKVRLEPRINIKDIIDRSRSLTRSVVLNFHLTELDGLV